MSAFVKLVCPPRAASSQKTTTVAARPPGMKGLESQYPSQCTLCVFVCAGFGLRDGVAGWG